MKVMIVQTWKETIGRTTETLTTLSNSSPYLKVIWSELEKYLWRKMYSFELSFQWLLKQPNQSLGVKKYHQFNEKY